MDYAMKRVLFTLPTEKMIIAPLVSEDVGLLMEYEHKNSEHLAKWEPERSDDYFSYVETNNK